jgi:subtilisin family serine protease
VCVATGNSRTSTRYVTSPADTLDYAIGVAATNAEAPSVARSAYFSNVGPDNGASDMSLGVTTGARPWVAAPGMKVEAQMVTSNGDLTTKELSGTSMAAPVVAGAIARLVQLEPQLGYEGVRDRVARTAAPVPRAGDTEVGHGMIHIDNLLNDTEPSTSQEDASNDAANARDAMHQSTGGWF